MWLSVWIKKKKIPQGLRGKEYTNQFSLQSKGAVTVEDYWTECQYHDIVWVCFMFGNRNHCCFCCGHPCTMLGVSLFISCKNEIQCVCVKKKNLQKKKNRIIPHCEIILIHLTKVTKWLKENNKCRSLKVAETHTICYQKGALLQREKSNSSLILAYLTKSTYLVNFNLNLVNPGHV